MKEKMRLLRSLKKAIRPDVMIWAYRRYKGKKVMSLTTICSTKDLEKILEHAHYFPKGDSTHGLPKQS